MSRALLLVAHPNDEAVFAGQLLLSTPRTEWDIACLTLPAEQARIDSLNESTEVLRDLGVSIVRLHKIGLSDGGLVPTSEWYQDGLWRVRQLVNMAEYDAVFTHNRKGDYGHPHHIACNAIAREVHGTVLEFLYPGATGIGQQSHGMYTRGFGVLSGKHQVLRVYQAEMDQLLLHYPELHQWAHNGPEDFTGPCRWPL